MSRHAIFMNGVNSADVATAHWQQLVAWCNGPDDCDAPRGYYSNICAKRGDNHDSDERESLDDWMCEKCAPAGAAVAVRP